MHIDRRLLTIIGRRFPAIYDVIPRGPWSYYSASSLDPQPLPPQELGAALAAEYVYTASLADRFGIELTAVMEALDDLCPPYPKLPKRPPGWPPIPDPGPPPEWLPEFHLGFAARLAFLTNDVKGTPLAKSFDRAIERSLESIETAMSESSK